MAQAKITSALGVKNAKPGRHSLGGGLILEVTKTGKRSWRFRYQVNKRRRDMALGSVDDVSLADARARAAELQSKVRKGFDPLEAQQQEAQQQALEAAGVPTFTSLAAQYVRAHRRSWVGKRTAWQWVAALKTYAVPAFGAKSVDEISTEDILGVLRPLWYSKTETGRKLQIRLQKIMQLAVSRKHRPDNPAQWRDLLEMELPSPNKVMRQRNGGTIRHFPAMPFQEVPSFYAELQQSDALGALALRLTIISACRTSEVLQARWSEIDLAEAIWTIPASRMKQRIAHRVPLTDEALAILERLPRISGEPWLFPGQRAGRPLSGMAMLMAMRKRGYGVGGERGDYVPHGFRSSFRDYCGEISSAPRHVAEAALAHVNADKVEAAYLRSDLFDRRRKLMEEWSAFATRPPAQVLNLDQHRHRQASA